MMIWRLGGALAGVLGVLSGVAALTLDSANDLSQRRAQPLNAVNLLPNGPIELYPYDFEDSNKSCSETHILRYIYNQFALPYNPLELQLLFEGRVVCGSGTGVINAPPRGILFALAALDILIDCPSGAIVVNGGILGQAAFPVALYPGSNDLSFTLILDKRDSVHPVKVCLGNAGEGVGTSPSTIRVYKTPELVKYIQNIDSVLENGVVVGPRGTHLPAARASVSRLVLVTGLGLSSSSCLPPGEDVLQQLNELQTISAQNSLPEIVKLKAILLSAGDGVVSDGTAREPLSTSTPVSSNTQNSAKAGLQNEVEVEVEQEIQIVAEARDFNGDFLQLKLTVYGLPREDCDGTGSCGDAEFFATTQPGPTDIPVPPKIESKVVFPISGRFIARASVSDGSGVVVQRDLVLLVRKLKDTSRAAPCCRHTPYITAHNLGRPIDRTFFRSGASREAAIGELGWSEQYWAQADLEAERLFDYGILAPQLHQPSQVPVEKLTCADVRLAGAGSPEVYGLLWGEDEVRGHGKILTIVPEAFPWASNSSEVQCQKHWSGWHKGKEAGQYKKELSSSTESKILQKQEGEEVRFCTVGCTWAGVQKLVQSTGMVDHYNQALIQASNGALAMSPYVRILPEVQIEKSPSFLSETSSAFSYYDAPARAAVRNSNLPRPWMTLILAPLALHQIPKHRAWSDGLASGGATITHCFASMYYAVHETGHRLGFRHGQLWKLEGGGHAAPADPLGAGEFVKDDNYRQRMDIMSCCRSDFGLMHRTLAGWLKGSKRSMLGEEDLQQPGVRKYVIWPFDRSESRGNLVSVAVRRSKDEILLLGFRSASHWQEPRDGLDAAEQARQNVRGIQVEYIRRDVTKGGGWGERAVLDFNLFHGDWPEALALAPGEPPQKSNFALLKEGRSWYDAKSRILLNFERIEACDGRSEVQLHNHTVRNFMGFRGEWPGQEAFREESYFGYGGLECAYVTIMTDAAPPVGNLELELTAPQLSRSGGASDGGVIDRWEGSELEDAAGGGGGGEKRVVQALFNATNGALLQQVDNSALCVDTNNDGLAFPKGAVSGEQLPEVSSSQLLQIELRWPETDKLDVVAVVWKDRWNRTLGTVSEEELSGLSATVISVPTAALPVSAHVLAADGRHSRAQIGYPRSSTSRDRKEYAVSVQYMYYRSEGHLKKELALGVLPRCIEADTASTKTLFIATLAVGTLLGIALASVGVYGAMGIVKRRRESQLQPQVSDQGAVERKTTVAALAAAGTEEKIPAKGRKKSRGKK